MIRVNKIMMSIFSCIYIVSYASQVPVGSLVDAIDENQTERALKLISQVDDINALDNEGLTPLMEAFYADNMNVFKALLADPRLEINAVDKNQPSILMLAVLMIEGQNYDFLKELIKIPTIDFNQTDEEGNTALMLAVLRGDIYATKLLAPKTEINHQNKDDETALILAVVSRNRPIIKILLRNGANPGIENKARRNSLQIASRSIKKFMEDIMAGRKSESKIMRRKKAILRYNGVRQHTRNRIRDLHQPSLFGPKKF